MSRNLEIGSDAQVAWALANAEACFAGDKLIHPVHFLLAVLIILDASFPGEAEDMGLPPEGIEALLAVGAKIRKAFNQPPEAIARACAQLRASLREGREPGSLRMLHRAETSRLLFKGAAKRALFSQAHYIGLLHLWEELLATQGHEIQRYFPDFDGHARKSSYSSLGSSQEARWQVVDGSPSSSASGVTPVMDELGRDITRLAGENRLPAVVGRKAEMRATARFLLRTSKRGVMLVGDAGVGKTAIVEGLAQRMVAGDAPHALRSMRIVQVDVADLISGTKYRGDMEQRLRKLIAEAESNPNIILFFDEAHLLMQAGAGSGPLDMANILKPALARDSFRCIGATTTEEFERYIRPDAAFMRRFQVVRVAEPSRGEAGDIATAWARRIEALQQVEFSAAAIERAVELADELITDRLLPDSAIDLLENAAAYSQVSSLTQLHVMPTKANPRITPALVEQVLEEVHGVGAKRELFCDPETLLARLGEDIVGQRAALKRVADTLAASQLPGQNRERPLAVMLFTGPTGVGKTCTGERLAHILFGGESPALLQINMGEFKERHELARITGAPPGFIGHEQEPALFRFVRANPRGLILLDEMEKAHPEIQDFFLQIFDNGVACDSHGRPAYFRNMMFVMSCNVVESAPARSIGFVASEAEAGAALLDYFRPEFLGRVDGVIPFHNLACADFELLLRRKFTAFADGIREDYGVDVQLDETAAQRICEKLMHADGGARGFFRRIEREIFIPSLKVIKSAGRGEKVKITYDGETVDPAVSGDSRADTANYEANQP